MIILKRLLGWGKIYDTDAPETVYPSRYGSAPIMKKLLCEVIKEEKELDFLKRTFPNRPDIILDFEQSWYYVLDQPPTEHPQEKMI